MRRILIIFLLLEILSISRADQSHLKLNFLKYYEVEWKNMSEEEKQEEELEKKIDKEIEEKDEKKRKYRAVYRKSDKKSKPEEE